MQILSALATVVTPALCTLTGFDFRRVLVLERMNSIQLRVEESYDCMADQIQSAIFSGLDSSSGVSQEQLNAAARNVDLVLGRFRSQPIGKVSVADDAFSAAFHELFVNNLMPKAQSASKGDASHNALDILVLYDRCLQSAEQHGMVPHTAFPFMLASSKLMELLRLINWTSHLERGTDVQSIDNTLTTIRELFEDADTSTESLIPSLIKLRSLFVKECRLFFSVVPDEYSSLYPDVVVNAFNAFRMLENMLSMAISIALLPKEGLELLDDAVEMAKAHVAHVVIGCVRRSVPTDILVKNLISGPGQWYLRALGSIRDYVFNTYHQDIYPMHAVSIFRPVVDVPSSTFQDAETMQMDVSSSTFQDAETMQMEEDMPEKPSTLYRNSVFAVLGIAAVGALASIPIYFLRRKSHD